MKITCYLVAACFWIGVSTTSADSIGLTNGVTMDNCIVAKQSDTKVIVLKHYATFTYLKSFVESVNIEKPLLVPNAKTQRRLPNWQEAVSTFLSQNWVDDIYDIPSTVIDKGVLKNVPYQSYKSGDYEFNIYGDLENPACIEIGIYKQLLANDSAKKNCVHLMESLLQSEKDRQTLRGMSLKQGLRETEGLTVEVTPETADDAYGGWWISIYDTKMLDAARASAKEMANITIAKSKIRQSETTRLSAATTQPVQSDGDPQWTASDLNYSRGSSNTSSSDGSVYVHGYTKKDGAYVHSYTRSAPSHR